MLVLNLCFIWMGLLVPIVHGGFLLPSFLEFGSCFDYPQKPDFEMNKFAGTWYTVRSVPNEYIPIVACSNANYTQVDDHVECRERGLNADGEKKSRVTKLELLPHGSPTTFIAQGEGLRPTAPINVIATDYVSYACTYSCIIRFAMKAEFAWVLSRSPALDRRSLEICDRAFTDKAAFKLEKLEEVSQGKACPYWPHLGPEQKSAYLFTTLNDIEPLEEEPEDHDERLQAASKYQTMSAALPHEPPIHLVWLALAIVCLLSS